MWKDYSKGYLKNNRASGISVMTAAFISALLLSLLCSLFYNLWAYEVERVKADVGDWEGRLTGEISGEDLELIQNYGNVERAVFSEGPSEGQEESADLYFKDKRSIFQDMPRIAELAGLSEKDVTCNYELLNLYLIRDPEDPALRWVFPFFLAVVLFACLSLVMVIHNAFAVTMNSRIRQFGIFSSIGAAPGQIRTCLLQEAFWLCTLPILTGNLLGILISMVVMKWTNVILADVERHLVLPFQYHPLILVLSILVSVITVWISAWIPARKMGRLTPLEAIKNTGELQLKRKRDSRFLSCFFGIEGELAGNALKAQKKAMRTASISLTLSFLAFSFMMCFFAIMRISQRETYFEKYQDAWDIMAEVRDTEIDVFDETDALQMLSGVRSSVVYQKAAAKRVVAETELSEEMRAAGGLENAPAEYVSHVPEGWLVNAPLVILDDDGFSEYCRQIGVKPRLDGAVILNQTRDAGDPNFRERRSFPYLAGNGQTTVLQPAEAITLENGNRREDWTAELPVIAYTQEAPVLREEYGTLDFYELVHVIPVSVWKEIKGKISGQEENVWIRILAGNEVTLKELNEVEEEVSKLLGGRYDIEIENRIQARLDNDNMIHGMTMILSVFFILLALIGIGNVFSNTFGFVRQRKREFARLLSVGMTPEGMKKVFCVEALAIAGRPVLTALSVTVAAVILFLKISYLDPMTFIREAPLMPIFAFLLLIFGSVALAYYLGARKLMGSSLADALRDDTVM
ncbi:MAG: ABC transporter permease [Schaedlerella sp.]|uniref:ABC transporter permease n=1 Tax=Schaedlerella sp. TaxID=2676057 RepID=UPI0035297F7C